MFIFTNYKDFLSEVNVSWLSKNYNLAKNYPINWKYFTNETELLSVYKERPTEMPLVIKFHTDNPWRNLLDYEILTNPMHIETPSTNQLFASLSSCRHTPSHSLLSIFNLADRSDKCPSDQYVQSGFLAVQTLLDFTKIRVNIC